jgi:5-methyltetrahydrofolate--homocysteine methyltransferase
MVDLKIIAGLVIDGEEAQVRELVEQAITEGVEPLKVLNDGLIAGMDVVGERMGKYEMYLPEVILSAMTMKAGMDVLRPLLAASGFESGAKVVLGTVKGDIHEIGKDLVGIMLEGGGFEVVDLGKDVPPEEFVRATLEEKAKIVGMSALLTTTMPQMRITIEALKAAGLREKVKVIIGGAPVTAEYARQIGADGYGRDAVAAVAKVRELLV